MMDEKNDAATFILNRRVVFRLKNLLLAFQLTYPSLNASWYLCAYAPMYGLMLV